MCLSRKGRRQDREGRRKELQTGGGGEGGGEVARCVSRRGLRQLQTRCASKALPPTVSQCASVPPRRVDGNFCLKGLHGFVSQRKQMTRPCLGCSQPAKLRRCTRQALCAQCRGRPEFQILRRKEALSTGLQERWLPAPMAAANRRDPRLAPEKLYWWADVALVCAEKGLELP